MDYDCSGWASRANVLCADGATIATDAFKHQDGEYVPVVYMHQHTSVEDVLGRALLKNKPEGLYAYVSFNSNESGKVAKELVRHGDITAFSIYANKLIRDGNCVKHGNVRELSLVLAGANPKAHIDNVIMHGEEIDESVIFHGINGIEIPDEDNDVEDNDTEDNDSENSNGEEDENTLKHSEDATNNKEKKNMNKDSEKTIGDVLDTLTDEQMEAVEALVGSIIENDTEENVEEGDNDNMKHNVFENENNDDVLMQAEFVKDVISDAKRYGSMKESFIAHSSDYGIENIGDLFPEDTNLTAEPAFINKDTGWVSKVLNGVHHTPFSKVKTMFADIREDEARARGYIKGTLKKDEVFSLLKRSTSPTTVYKKQRLDRDDVSDITSFDILAWIKKEMRMKLDEELARAFLLGDQRLASSDDKIDEDCIRPIIKDSELFNVRAKIEVQNGATGSDKAKEFIRSIIKSRKDYKGSGNPTLFTTEDMLTECLLLEDQIGHYMYDSTTKLAQVLRVNEIVTVPHMENATGPNSKPVLGVIVNLNDYNVGADRGGSINMFDDFDIDYNQMIYLIETRCSAALTIPYSAVTFELYEAEA